MSSSQPSDPGGRRTPLFASAGSLSSFSQSDTQRSPTRSTFVHSDIEHTDDDDMYAPAQGRRGASPIPSRSYTEQSWAYEDDDSFRDSEEVDRALDDEFDSAEEALSGWQSVMPTMPLTFPRTELSVVQERSEPSTRSSLLSSRPPSTAFHSGTWNEDVLRRQRERLEHGGSSSPRPASPIRFGHSRGATDPGPGDSSPRSLRATRRAGDLIAYFESSTSSSGSGSSATTSYGQPRSPSPSKFSAPSHSYTQSVSMPSLSRTFQEASSTMHTRSPTMPNLSSYTSTYSRPSSPSKSRLMSPSMGTTASTSMTMSSLLSSPSRQLSSPSRPLSSLSLLSPPAASTTISSSVKSPPPRPVSPRSLPQTSVRNLVAAWTAATSSPSSSEGFFSIRRAAERRARQQEPGDSAGHPPAGQPAQMPAPLGSSFAPGGTGTGTGNRSSGSTGSSGVPSSFELPDLGEHFRTPDEPLRVGGLWYLNVHTAPPYKWQRCQAVLYPNKLLLTWIAAGGGRGVVTLDLLNCTEVRSVPSPTHPSAQEDVGTMAAHEQAGEDGTGFAGLLEMLCPFHLFYTDGVERLAAESARERVRWVGALWNAIERAATEITRASSPAPTIASFRSSASGSGSASTVFVPPLDSLPDVPDSNSTRSSSFASGSIMSYHASATSSSHASDDSAISNQGLVVPLGRSGSRLIAPSRSSSLRRTASLTDLDAEFASVARTLRSMGSGSSASGSTRTPSLLSVPSIPDIGSTRADSPAPSSRSRRSARMSEPPARLEADDVFYSASSAAPSASGSSSSGDRTSFYTPSTSPRKPQSITSPPSTGSEILRVLSPSSATQIVGSTLSYRRSDSASMLGDSHDESSEAPSTPSSKLSRSPGMRRRTPRRSRTASGAPDSEKENDVTESTITSPKSRTSGTPTQSDRTPRSARTVSGSGRSYSSSYRSGPASESGSARPPSSGGYDLCATSDWTDSSSCSSVAASGTRTPSVVETVGVYTSESAPSEHPPSTEYSTPSEPPPSTVYGTPSEGPPSSVYRTPSTHSSLITERSHGTTFQTARTPSDSGSFRTIPSWHSRTPTPSTEFTTAQLCPSEPSTAYATPSDGMASYLTPSASPMSTPTIPSLVPSRSPTLPPLPSSLPSSRPPSTVPSIPSYPSSSRHSSIPSPSYPESSSRGSSLPPPPEERPASPQASLYSESESDVTPTDESSLSTPTRRTPSILRSSPSPIGPRSMTPSSASIHTTSTPSSLTPSSPSSVTSSTVSSTTARTATPSSVSMTVTSTRISSSQTPTSTHLSVPTTSLVSTRRSPSPSSVSSISVSTLTASPIAPVLPSPTAPSFRESLWAGESNLSYDSSALMPSPSMGSMSLAMDDEASFESSVLRPTESYATDYIHVPQRSLYRAESARSYASSVLRPSTESLMGDDYRDEPTPSPSTVPLPTSPTPTMSASLTMSTPESNQPSILSQLETIPSLPEVVEEEEEQEEEVPPPPPEPIREHIVTEEVDRLIDYLRGLEESRAADARGLQDQLGRVEGSLFDLNNFVRGEERPPPVPRKDRSVGMSSAPPSERAPSVVAPSPRAPSEPQLPSSPQASLEPPPTPPMRIPTPSSIESSFSYLASPSTDLSLLDAPRERTPEPPSSSSSSSSSSSPSSPSSPPREGTPTERAPSRPPSRIPTPLPIGELRDLIEGVRQQTDNLLQAQLDTNAMLDDLRNRPIPEPVDHDLAQRKMASLQAIQDMVQYILETLVDREHTDLLDRLRNLLRGAGPQEPHIFAPSPRRSYAPSTILSDIGSMQHPPPPPPTDIGPPEPTPMIVRPPPRAARARSISPVLPQLPPRSTTAPPLGGPYPPIRPRRPRPAQAPRQPREPGEEEVDEPGESEVGEFDNVPWERPRRGPRAERATPLDEGPDLDFERFVRDRRRRHRPSGDGIWTPPGREQALPAAQRPQTVPPRPSDIQVDPAITAGWPRPAPQPAGPAFPGVAVPPFDPRGPGGMYPPGMAMPPPHPAPAVIVPSVTIPDEVRRQLAEQHEHSMAAADQLVQLTEFTDSLSRWLERERHDRQNEFRGLNDRVDDLRHQIGELARGGAFEGRRFGLGVPQGPPPGVPDPPIIPPDFEGRLPPLDPQRIIPVPGGLPPFIPPGPFAGPGAPPIVVQQPGIFPPPPPMQFQPPMQPMIPPQGPISQVPPGFSPPDVHHRPPRPESIYVPSPPPERSPRPGSRPPHTDANVPHGPAHSRPHTPIVVRPPSPILPPGGGPIPIGMPPGGGPIPIGMPPGGGPLPVPHGGVTVIQPPPAQGPIAVGPPILPMYPPSRVPEAEIPLPPSRFSHRSHGHDSPASVHVDVHPPAPAPQQSVPPQGALSHVIMPVPPQAPQEILVRPGHDDYDDGGRRHRRRPSGDYSDDDRERRHRRRPSGDYSDDDRERRHRRRRSRDYSDDDGHSPHRRRGRPAEYDNQRRGRRRRPSDYESDDYDSRRRRSRSRSRDRERRPHRRRSSRRDDRSPSRETRPPTHRPGTTDFDPHQIDPRLQYAQPTGPGATGTHGAPSAFEPTASTYPHGVQEEHAPTVIPLPPGPMHGGLTDVMAPSPRHHPQLDVLNEAARAQALRDQEQRLADEHQRVAAQQQELADRAAELARAQSRVDPLIDAHQTALEEARGAQDALAHRFGDAELGREDTFARHEADRQRLFEESEDRRRAEAEARRQAIFNVPPTLPPATLPPATLPPPSPPHVPSPSEEQIAAAIPPAPSRHPTPPLEAPVVPEPPVPIPAVVDLSDHQRFLEDMAEQMKQQMAQQLEDMRNQHAAAIAAAEERERKLAELVEQSLGRREEEERARVAALEEELRKAKEEQEEARLLREQQQQEQTDRNLASLNDNFAGVNSTLGDITNLLKARDEVDAAKRAAEEERYADKDPRRAAKEEKQKEIVDLLGRLVHCCDEFRGRSDEDRAAAASRQEDLLTQLRTQGTDFNDQLRSLGDGLREDNARRHEEVLGTVRESANSIALPNIEDYLNKFSRALAEEVRILLSEVGNLRHERRTLQYEIGEYLTLKSKLDPGGQFDNTWVPVIRHWQSPAWFPGGGDGGPPPGAPGAPGMPMPEPAPEEPPARPAWRNVRTSQRGPKLRKATKENAPPPSAAPTPAPGPAADNASWTTWAPNPRWMPSPMPPTMPAIPEVVAPGLFGPREMTPRR